MDPMFQHVFIDLSQRWVPLGGVWHLSADLKLRVFFCVPNMRRQVASKGGNQKENRSHLGWKPKKQVPYPNVLGVDSPLFGTLVLFKHRSPFQGFGRFFRQNMPKNGNGEATPRNVDGSMLYWAQVTRHSKKPSEGPRSPRFRPPAPWRGAWPRSAPRAANGKRSKAPVRLRYLALEIKGSPFGAMTRNGRLEHQRIRRSALDK